MVTGVKEFCWVGNLERRKSFVKAKGMLTRKRELSRLFNDRKHFLREKMKNKKMVGVRGDCKFCPKCSAVIMILVRRLSEMNNR